MQKYNNAELTIKLKETVLLLEKILDWDTKPDPELKKITSILEKYLKETHKVIEQIIEEKRYYVFSISVKEAEESQLMIGGFGFKPIPIAETMKNINDPTRRKTSMSLEVVDGNKKFITIKPNLK